MKKILIMGLPGSGKTTLAGELRKLLPGSVVWLNADEVRRKFNDWDFSHDGNYAPAERRVGDRGFAGGGVGGFHASSDLYSLGRSQTQTRLVRSAQPLGVQYCQRFSAVSMTNASSPSL